MDSRFSQVSTLIVKVTHRCNLDCLYCYENITKQGEDMRLETFRELVDLVLMNSAKPLITFLFHGGEPSLLPNEWYDEAIGYAQEQARLRGKRVGFSMQTNLLGINPSKIELFKRHKIQLGISLDSPAALGSTMRGGEDRVFRNFKTIQRAGIAAGVLVTINQSNFAHFDRICRWLVTEAEVNAFKANVVTPVGRGYELDPMQAEQVYQAQHAILDYMIETKGRALHEHNLCLEIERFFAGRDSMSPTLCHERRCGAGSAVLGVTPQGALLPCGRFTWDESAHYIGQLAESSAADQRAFVQANERFHALVPESWYDCDGCAAKSVCGFGCQAFIVRSKAQANVDCLPTKMRFAYYTERQAELRPVYEAILARRGQSPAPAPLPFRVRQSDGTFKTYAFPR